MKPSNAITISTLTLVFLLLFLLLYNYKSHKRQSRQKAIEEARRNFIQNKFEGKNDAIDSVYAKDDTILFFKNRTLVGMSITETR